MADVYHQSEYKQPVKWVPTDKSGSPPPNAVLGGKDNGGDPLYVGRACVSGDCIPGKIHYRYGFCYVPYNGEEHSKTEYQVLVNPDDAPLDWAPGKDGRVPLGAVQGGQQRNGEKLYIGRGDYGTLGAQHIGKVHPSHGGLYISYGGKEIKLNEYEVLVVREITH